MAAVFAPFWQLLTDGAGPIAFSLITMGLLLVWRHEANIKRLFAGTESRLGGKAAAAHAVPVTKKGGRAARH